MKLYFRLVRLFFSAGTLFGILLGTLLALSTGLSTGLAGGTFAALFLALGVPALLLIMGRKNRVVAS